MTGLIVFVAVICLGYASYQVWFQPQNFIQMLQELYAKSSTTPRAFAKSKFTLWGFRVITTVLFLLTLLLCLGSAYSWLLSQSGAY